MPVDARCRSEHHGHFVIDRIDPRPGDLLVNLDPIVRCGRVDCDAVRWQGSQRAVARVNRLSSVLTYWVMACGQGNRNSHAASEAMESGQLPI